MATDPTTEPLPTAHDPAPDAGAGSTPAASPAWVTLSRPERVAAPERPVRVGPVLAQLVAGVLVVLVVVGVLGALAAQRLAEREAVNDAATTADVLAEAVIQPAVTDALLTGDAKAVAAMDAVVRQRVLGPNVVRVKIWGTDGTVLYADEPQLVGRTFALDAEQREVLASPRTQAEVSDLTAAENVFETGDRLLEVYRPVWTPTGKEALFEMYAPYQSVGQRASQLGRGFAGVTLSSLLLLVVLVVPLLWHLTRRLQRAQGQRELLLERAVDASTEERRRVAATLHDGPVQELAATSFAVAGAAARADAAHQPELSQELQAAAGSVRSSIRALRSLLVDIYPPSLAGAGLGAALTDLAQSLRGRQVDVRLDVPPPAELALTAEQDRLVYRVTQELLRNSAQHAAPCRATVTLRRDGDHVVLEVDDDGRGFDVAARLAEPEEGHFGLSLVADVASTAGADLAVASAPGSGTRWRLVVPVEGEA
ncbi:sensor histidine kinase [Angustibacter peucedani]